MKVGDRVRLSAKAHEHRIEPKHPQRRGVLTRLGRYAEVLWDGRRSAEVYAIEFVEKDDDGNTEHGS